MLFLHHYPMPTYIGISYAISSLLSYANLNWHLLCYFFTIILLCIMRASIIQLILASLMLFLHIYPMPTYIGISYVFLHYYPLASYIGLSYVISSPLSYANLSWHLLCFFFTIILFQLIMAYFMLFLHFYPPMYYDS